MNLPKKFYFDDFLEDFFPENKNWNSMKCDIYEKDDKYFIEMDVPGLQKEDIKIDSSNGYLTIETSKKIENNEEGKDYIRKERTYGHSKRQFYIGDVDPSEIKAEFKHGVLKITIPKVDEKPSKNIIEIQD
ncbi:MAG: Hsp20/alpha crystallin family protein [Bacilli bacterium]|nr:Hsp20/alpha crystallin family protein [Bacilli bacterium]